MSGVRTRFNNREWKKGIAALGRRFPQAARRSLRRAGTAGRTAVSRKIRGDLGIKVSIVKEAVTVRVKPSSVEIAATGSRIPLIEFKARGREPSGGRGRGVGYRIGKRSGRIGDAFITTMPSGRRGVFRRSGKSRLPIHELKGPSITHVFRREMPGVIPKVKDALFKNFRHEFSRAAARR